MVLERFFDDYFGGAVPTKTIDILIVSDANARQVALETGEVDMTNVATSEVPTLKDKEGIKIWAFNSIGAHGLQLNCAARASERYPPASGCQLRHRPSGHHRRFVLRRGRGRLHCACQPAGLGLL